MERASRRPEALRALLAEARAEHGKAGPQATARAAEEARRRRVTERLVDYGRLRAHSVGWPDVYTFTKALGERVAEQYARDEGLRVSVVRPAIVQSALRHPFPGWFDSFKMVDPIILSYGRGTLPDVPGPARRGGGHRPHRPGHQRSPRASRPSSRNPARRSTTTSAPARGIR